MNRKVAALLLGVAGVLVASVTAAAAAPGGRLAPLTSARPGATTVPNDAITLAPAPGATGASGSGLALTLDPGGSIRQDIVVTNTTPDLRLTVRMDPVDARDGTAGAVTFAKTAAAEGPASWLTISDRVLVVEPGATATVPVSIATPSDAEPGKSIAGVRATVEDAVATAGGAGPGERPSTALLVTMTVNGEVNAVVSVIAVKPSQSGTTLDIELRNIGDAPAHVAGRVRVSRPLPDDHSFQADVPARGSVIANVPWAKPSADRPADVDVEVDYGDGSTASWSGAIDSEGNAATGIQGVDAPPTTTAAPAPANDASGESAPAPTPGRKGWNPLTVLALLALLAAGGWFVLELRRAGPRRGGILARYAREAAEEVDARREGEERRRHRRPELRPSVVTPIPAPVTASTTATVTMGPPVVTVAPDALETLTRQLATMTDAITASTQPRIDAVTPAALEALVRQLGALTRNVERLIDRLGDAPLMPAGGIDPGAAGPAANAPAMALAGAPTVAPGAPALMPAQFISPPVPRAAPAAAPAAPERAPHAAPRRLPTLSSRAARARDQARVAGAMTDEEPTTAPQQAGAFASVIRPVVLPDGSDLYSWPTEDELDRFVARRKGTGPPD